LRSTWCAITVVNQVATERMNDFGTKLAK